ncbi:MAG: carbamoyltransferase [Myxococcota bacterium]|nr:carbamoyltransferase [Myxococcota bacterium]
MKILGISAFYHDSAAALVDDGNVVAAAQEERFTRIKHDPTFPTNAIRYCLDRAGVQMADVDYVAFYDKPFLKFERLLETYLAYAPRGFQSFRMAIPLWLKEKLFQRSLLSDSLQDLDPNFDSKNRLLFSEHHLSHGASAFFPSPFEEAAVLTMDGVGEWATTSVSIGRGSSLKIHKEIHWPHSLGLLYSAFTYYTGFKVNSGEYKVMGLAPYGEPRFTQTILDNLIDVKEDGSFRLDQSYFDYCTGLRMTNDRFSALFGEPVRTAESPLTQFHMDIAASVQAAIEHVVLKMTRSVAKDTGLKNLCLAGGVALNCVANGKILRDGAFDQIWIQPAAGDAGGSLGAALSAYYDFLDNPRSVPPSGDFMQGSYLGPEFTTNEAADRLKEVGATYQVLEDDELIQKTAQMINDGAAIGWFQGRMEFGPRALGNRSIIADARNREMQSVLNLKVKYRESFRPFAPSVRREDVADWFQIDSDSPYMLLVADVANDRQIPLTDEEQALFGIEKLKIPRSDIPAVTHVDHSARVQTVHTETNKRYHDLISAFKELGGCPVIVNTSFNVRGEPIVCTPEDAFRCFMGTELDVLVVENCFLLKTDQDAELKTEYKNAFALD